MNDSILYILSTYRKDARYRDAVASIDYALNRNERVTFTNTSAGDKSHGGDKSQKRGDKSRQPGKDYFWVKTVLGNKPTCEASICLCALCIRWLHEGVRCSK